MRSKKTINEIDTDNNLSVVVRAKVENIETNVMLDTGAGVSVIDVGTLERLDLMDRVSTKEWNPKCFDASGNRMKIIGSITLETRLVDSEIILRHKFQVLDIRSYHSIILGRDFMSNYRRVEFDFERNMIKLGQSWLHPIVHNNKQTVRLCEDVTIQSRSEEVIEVRCSMNRCLVTGEYFPKSIPGCRGVYTSKAQVTPDIDGRFFVTVLNVNEHPMKIKKKHLLGHIVKSSEVVNLVHAVKPQDRDVKTVSFEWDRLTIGGQLSNIEKGEIMDVIREFRVVFATNPKNRKELMSYSIKSLPSNRVPFM